MVFCGSRRANVHSILCCLDRCLPDPADHDNQHHHDKRGLLPPPGRWGVSRGANGSRRVVARRDSQLETPRHAELPSRGIQRGTAVLDTF